MPQADYEAVIKLHHYADNDDMEKGDFAKALESAVAEKGQEFDGRRLPQMLENYRLLHTCEKNLFELLVKRSLVKEDPYKLEKKVSKIECPDTGVFNETEAATIMGIRLSDYDTMLDYICTYLPATTQTLTEGKIRKLLEFNGCVDWTNFSANSTETNTRIVCEMIGTARAGAQQMTQRVIIDSLNNAKKALIDINTTLNDLLSFTREKTKCEVRKLVMGSALFDKDKAAKSGEALRSEIKRLWPSGMGKVPYNNELVMEIVREDCDSNASALQEAVLNSLKATVTVKKAEKAKVDPKALLVEGAVILSASAPQIEMALQKISANHDVLADCRATFFEKFKTVLRHAFGLSDPPEEYILSVTNKKTQAVTTRRIDYSEFYLSLEKRMKVYSLIANQSSVQHARIAASPETVLFPFLSKQIAEMQDVMILLDALDGYFKVNVTKGDKSRIKGLKIELATISNCVIKARSRCQEYSALAEEAKQMKELNAKGEGQALENMAEGSGQ